MLKRTLAASLLMGSTLVAGSDLRVSAQASEPVTIRFAAQVGDEPFDCGRTYELGSESTPMRVSDFRFYVSDIRLLDKAGRAVPVALEQDGQWQYETVALLDFEDQSGACVQGTVETRDVVVGTVPAGDYVGLQFTLGVPFQLNHGDVASASPPLHLTPLWWNWRGGYKFVRIDLQPIQAGLDPLNLVASTQLSGHGHEHPHPNESAQGGFPIHLGSTGCRAPERDQPPQQPCLYPNRVEVTFPNFDPKTQVVVADLAALLAQTNVTQNQLNTPPGCMSTADDRDCDSIFSRFGITGSQQFFRVK
ncbi:MAG: MbnP family copper-binding protein [Cyanobacteriota bacterium]